LKPPPEAEAPACYASSIDAYGERAVWWSQATRGGVEVVQAVVSDVKGILAIDALALSRGTSGTSPSGCRARAAR